MYGLEYDLNVYHIVAVSDFNMGAMENKGLNVFNTACVLAKPTTATDADYERVQVKAATGSAQSIASGNRLPPIVLTAARTAACLAIA